MQILPPTIHGLLDLARDLVERKGLDTKLADKILGQIPYVATLDAQTRGAIQHAKLVVTTAAVVSLSGLSRFFRRHGITRKKGRS